MTIPLEHSLVFASLLFGVGLAGFFIRRNLLMLFICLEIMFNAAAFAFVAVACHYKHTDGQVMFLLILSVAAAEVAVALALVLLYHHRFKTLDIDAAHELKG